MIAFRRTAKSAKIYIIIVPLGRTHNIIIIVFDIYIYIYIDKLSLLVHYV